MINNPYAIDCTDEQTTSPDYYILPNGTQVLDISQYLTGLGAQIVQYVSRACRTDGVIKMDPTEDLRKALDLTIYEIFRIEEKPDLGPTVVATINKILDETLGTANETP